MQPNNPTDTELETMAEDVRRKVYHLLWPEQPKDVILAALKSVRQQAQSGSPASPSCSDESATNRDSAPVDFSKPYWRCACGTVAMPLTDDTRCLCSDLYEQEWTRWVPIRDTGCTRYPVEAALPICDTPTEQTTLKGLPAADLRSLVSQEEKP